MNMLIDDQNESFGCLNMQCCSQVSEIVRYRFQSILCAFLGLIVYLVVFFMTTKSMARKLGVYRNNHAHDWFWAVQIVIIVMAFV